MTDKTIVKVSMNGRGVVGRRGFLRGLGLGAAGLGLSGLSFTDLMAVHADELRKKQMACILLWMAGGPSQFETFDPKPDHPNGGGHEDHRDGGAGPPGRRGLGEDRRGHAGHRPDPVDDQPGGQPPAGHYQLHTGYPPTGTLKHPALGSVVAAELGDPSSTCRTSSASMVGRPAPASSARPMSHSSCRTRSSPPPTSRRRSSRDRFTRRLGLLDGLERAGFGRRGGADRVEEHRELYRQTAGMVLSPRMSSFDLEGEKFVPARRLWPQSLRSGLPAGAATGRNRRHLRRGRFHRRSRGWWQLGHAPEQPRTSRRAGRAG